MSLGVLLSANRSSPEAEPPGKDGRISVCHIASGDLWAGAEVQLADLLGALSRRPEIILRVILLNEGRLSACLRQLGLELKVIPEGEKSFVELLREATGFLRDRGVHVLHSHRYKENLLAMLLALRCRVPFLVRSQHGLPEPFGGIRRLRHGLFQALDRLLARYGADRVISVSAEMQRHLARFLNPRRIVVIQNGLDTERVGSALDASAAKRKLGVPEDAWVVGYAGRLEPIKRLDIFLKAATLISARAPSARFVIAGEGREEAKLRDLAVAEGLAERVLFLGHREDVYDVLRAMEVFVLCSDHEGLPMVLLEALYLGVPVVARAVGGISEVIQAGECGILVQSGDPHALAEACLEILTDEPRRARLALAGTRLVRQRFSAERTAAETLQLYSSLCGRTRGSPL